MDMAQAGCKALEAEHCAVRELGALLVHRSTLLEALELLQDVAAYLSSSTYLVGVKNDLGAPGNNAPLSAAAHITTLRCSRAKLVTINDMLQAAMDLW